MDDYKVFTIPDDRKFRILQLTDVHLGGGIVCRGKDKKCKAAVTKVIRAANPDLIILTGDNIYPIPFNSGTVNNMRQSHKFGEFMESFGIPWAFVFGNHDVEVFATHNKEQLAQYYTTLPHCLFSRGPEDISGLGNYILKLNDAKGNLQMALVLLDSNMYITNSFFSGFDNIHDEQVEWYTKELTKLCEENGRIVPSLAFFHIPINEYRDAWEALKAGDESAKFYYGECFERYREKYDYFGVPENRGKLFDAILKLGSTKGVFCGHDHLNTTSVEYKGVRLTYGMSIDYLAYFEIGLYHSQRGGTVIDISADGSFDVRQLSLDSIRE